MKPRGKRTSERNHNAFQEVSQVKTEGTTPEKMGASTLVASESVQCEMGTEIFRRYWKALDEGMEENESDQVITGDPIGTDHPGRYIVAEEGDDCNIANKMGQPTTAPDDKVDANKCSNWSNTFTSGERSLEKGHDEDAAACKDTPSLVLTNNGSDTVVFPLVLNVVDESGTKEVVAVVSIDALPPSDNSNNLAENEEAVSESIGANVGQPEVKLSRTFTCGDCRQLLFSIVQYEKHCLEHNSTEPFKCTRCARRFKRRQDLDRHIVCHPEEAFSCGTCFAKFSDREELMFHSKTHESVPDSPKISGEDETPEVLCKVEAFHCSQCDKIFDDADLLQHHEFTHNEGELFPCDQCGRTFREESRLGMHLKLHKKNQRCDKCDEIFTNMFDFNEHMIAHKYEDSKEDYKCVHCKVSFNSFYFLKKHASSHGMDVRWCGDCGGSGHVGSPHNEHNSGGTNSACEKTVLMMVKKDNSKQEEDPLKLDDTSSDCLVEEHLLDEVVIKDERTNFSDEEAEMPLIANVQEKTGRRKRKYS